MQNIHVAAPRHRDMLGQCAAGGRTGKLIAFARWLASGAIPTAKSVSLADELKELEAQGITPQPSATGASIAVISQSEPPECFFPRPNQPPYLWSCNVIAMHVFMAMQTQWRVGMAGATGLDYGVLPAVMDMMCVDMQERRRVFSKVRVVEAEFLAAWAKRREEMARQRKTAH